MVIKQQTRPIVWEPVINDKNIMEKEEDFQNQENYQESILRYLRNNPGQRSREIAISLGLEKKQVNGSLYGDLKNVCSQGDDYRWYLNERMPDNKKAESRPVAVTALSNLSHYYLACLGQDDEGGISVFADNKFDDLDYTELKSLPLNGNNACLSSPETQKLLGKIRKDNSRLEMYFGYPTALRKARSKKTNWEGFFVEPILLFPVEITDGKAVISQGFPIVNLSVLKRFTNTEREQVMDELVQLEEELGLTSEANIPELDDLTQRLESIRPEWPWKENIEPHLLSDQSSLREIRDEGIFNKAVLLVAERSVFTQGLESELKSLGDLSLSQYHETSLGKWISGDFGEKKKDDNLPLLEVLSLNSEQRQAIQHSLTSPLTIITGPPGTGKSQVVTNLLINAAWQGKKVLFASKNNKAVDVVEIRVNNLGVRPVLLRMGSNQYQTKLAEYLVGLLTSTSTEHDLQEFEIDKQRYKQLEEAFLNLEKQESELVRLRNETDELDQSIEKIRSDVSSEVFDQLRRLDTARLKASLVDLERSLKSAHRESQNIFVRLFWNFLRAERLKRVRTEMDNIRPATQSLRIDLPDEVLNENNVEDWKAFLQKAETYLSFAQDIKEYKTSLKLLQEAKPLEEITRDKIDITTHLASNAENLWKGWLRLQPSRLSNEDRQLLNKYNALLKMVIDAGGEIYSKLGKKVYREYSNLSKTVSHLLPAWAVTSLSARGRIPFEAGYFDLVIFDEASQCDIASALPLLFRAKQAVIIGDPKQLRHISGLQRGQDQQLLEKYNLIPDFAHWAYSYNSLFDLASGLVAGGDIINLRDHHRSHEDIIEFSNQEFYQGNLRIATNYDRLKLLDSGGSGIRWINVVGNVVRPANGGAVNQIEAKAVIGEIKKLILERNYKGSIGVVTPFRAQANLIREMVNIEEGLSANLVNHDFLVDTVHKFQGDERDIMIFSPVVSKNMPQGALGFMKNNGNLFNVAITRARAMLLVVGDQDATVKCDVSYLKNFAIYTQQLDGKTKAQTESANVMLGEEYPTVSNPDRVSEWEHILYKALYAAGIKTIPQYQVEKYTLDFALLNGEIMLDIEVDGERYHRNWTGELCRRDQIRNNRLFELGWDVKRFWVYEVRDDIEGCIKRIKDWIRKE